MNYETGLGTYTQQQPQNPLQWLLDVNQKAGTAVLQKASDLFINNPTADALANKLNTVAENASQYPIGPVGWGDIAGEALVEVAPHLPQNWQGPALLGGMVIGASPGNIKRKARSLKLTNDWLNTLRIQRSELPVGREHARVSKEITDATRSIQAHTIRTNVDALDATSGKEVTKILKGQEASNFNTVAAGGFRTYIHHQGPLGTISKGASRIPITKQLDVENILADKYNRRLGHDLKNLAAMYSKEAHTFIAHKGDFKDTHIRAAMKKFNFETASAKESADFIELQMRHLEGQTNDAFYSKANVEAGWKLFNSLPTSIQRKLPKGFNPLSRDYTTEGWKDYVAYLNALPKEEAAKIRAQIAAAALDGVGLP